MIYINTPDNPIYATVWDVKPSENGKYIDLQASTSEHKQDGDYENSQWFPRVIGKALNTLKGLKARDRIAITKAKITNVRKETPEGKRSFFRFLILEAEIESGDRNKSQSEGISSDTLTANTANNDKPKEAPTPATPEDDCPW